MVKSPQKRQLSFDLNNFMKNAQFFFEDHFKSTCATF